MREANLLVARWQATRGMASESGPYDAVIIGGGALACPSLLESVLKVRQAPAVTLLQSRPLSTV